MAQNIIDTKIREAYDTEANWIKYNPVLLSGQLAYSSDKYGKYKVGNGASRWSQLQYATLGWGDITEKPSTFSPSTHTHPVSQVTGLTPSAIGAAPASHTHPTGNTTTLGLTKLYTKTGTAIDGTITQKGITETIDSLKYLCAPIGHTHTVSQITDFPNIEAITNTQIDSLANL